MGKDSGYQASKVDYEGRDMCVLWRRTSNRSISVQGVKYTINTTQYRPDTGIRQQFLYSTTVQVSIYWQYLTTLLSKDVP
jgi:hypothetical protein